MSKQDISIPALDCRIVKTLLDKFGFAKAAADRTALAALNAQQDMDQAESDYAEYFKRLGAAAGIDPIEDYQINFVTGQFELKPPPPKPQPPQKAPDANEPPAPFREFTSTEKPQ